MRSDAALDFSFMQEIRERRGLTQAEVADAVGISERHYRRIEQGRVFDPGIRVLHNCALVLGCTLYEMLPAEFLGWTRFSDQRPEPPEWEKFFRPERSSAPDITVSVPGDYLDHTEGWLEARVRGLRALAAQHNLPVDGPVLKIPGVPATDPRLESSLDVLNRAAANRGASGINPAALLLAIAEVDEGGAGKLLDRLNVRDAIKRRLRRTRTAR